jgi:hypothetical protein
MKAQTPAEGILKKNDWGDCKVYEIVCDCGQANHNHNSFVEADETGVSVQTFISVKSDYWSETIKPRYDIDSIWLQEIDWAVKGIVNSFINRVKLTWTLWTKGYVECETTLCMTKQQALNYAETLKSAIKDVEEFTKERKGKSAVTKMAEQGDCV